MTLVHAGKILKNTKTVKRCDWCSGKIKAFRRTSSIMKPYPNLCCMDCVIEIKKLVSDMKRERKRRKGYNGKV